KSASVTSTVTSTVTTGSPTANTAVTATINISTGLNARIAPTTTAPLVKLLNNEARYKVIGRSSDGQWLQVRLEDGTGGWIFAHYVIVSGNLNAVPVPLSAAPTALPTGTFPRTLPSAPTAAPTAPGVKPGEATATVTSLSGANVRAIPDRNAP